MKLDHNKRYEGLGLTWEFRGLLWIGKDLSAEKKLQATVYDSVMQTWLDAGHIQPVRETKIVRMKGVTVKADNTGYLTYVGVSGALCGGTRKQLAGRTSKPVTLEFEVEVDE